MSKESRLIKQVTPKVTEVAKNFVLPNTSNVDPVARLDGSTLSGFTPGSVLFVDANGKISEDNNNLFWDASNGRLGIGTNSVNYSFVCIGNIYASGSHLMANSQALGWGDSTTRIVGSSSTDIIQFFADSSEKVHIDSTGLDVTGTIECNKLVVDDIEIDGSLIRDSGAMTITADGGLTITDDTTFGGNIVCETSIEITTIGTSTVLYIDNQSMGNGDPIIALQCNGVTKGVIGVDDSVGDEVRIAKGSGITSAGIAIDSSAIALERKTQMEGSPFCFARATFTNADTTPTVSKGNLFFTNSISACTITNFDSATDNQMIIVVGTDGGNTTIQDNANINLAGSANFTLGNNDTIMLIYERNIGWCELSRSNN